MKRTLMALLSVTVVMLFAVSAFALHAVPEQYEYTPSMVKTKAAQIELGGHIRIRGEMNDNYVNFNDDLESDNTRAFFDQRARVHLKATVSPNTFGMIEFELNESTTDDSWDWGECGDTKTADGVTSGAKGTYRVGNCKPTGVTTRQAYIAHQNKALGFLAGFKLGHQLVALGNGLFYDHSQYGDDVITFWMSPRDGTEISFNLLKLGEGNSAFSDDTDGYVLTYAGALGGVNLSADVTYLNDNADSDFPVDFYNIGLRGDMTIGPAKVKADVEWQTGDVEDKNDILGNDLDFKGYAFMLGAEMNAGPVMVNLEGAYGSGNDIDEDDEIGMFMTSLSDGEQYTYLYDQKATTAALAAKTGLANTWYIMAGVSGNATPDLKLGLDLFYLQASEKVSDVDDFDDKDLGWEVDGKLNYQIDKNLVYYVEAGYLFAGDFYANVSGDPDNIDDAYSVRHGIILSF